MHASRNAKLTIPSRARVHILRIEQRARDRDADARRHDGNADCRVDQRRLRHLE